MLFYHDSLHGILYSEQTLKVNILFQINIHFIILITTLGIIFLSIK